MAQSCPAFCDPMECSTPGLPVHHQLLEFTQTHMSTESVTPSNHLILCRPLLLLPSIFPSIRGFSNELALHKRWPKYWSFSINPSDEYSGLISFRNDWLEKWYAAAAKSFQLCLTLCDPIDSSPPGSPLPGILQARTLELVAISFSNA